MDEEVKNKPEEETPEVETPEEETPEVNEDEKIEEVSEKIASSIRAKLGIENINEVSEKVDKFFDRQEKSNSKIMEILKSKDLSKNKGQLTKEEKIVGFYHALVTKDDQVCKALSEGTAADGGYLFPDEFRAELIRWMADTHRMRNLVRVIPMRKDVMNIPNLQSSVKLYWTAENATKTTTTAHFGTTVLTARKVAAILYASDELIEDSTEIDVVNLIIELFGEQLAEEEDRVIIQGNGTTEPTGILTAASLRTVTCAGNLDFDDIIDLIYALPQKYHSGSSFLVARENIKNLRKLKDGDSRYLWADPVSAGMPATILGYPVHEIDYVGEANILFGNWKMVYWLGDRKSLSVKISNDTTQAFTQDMTAIRVVARIAGNVVLADGGAHLQTIP